MLRRLFRRQPQTPITDDLNLDRKDFLQTSNQKVQEDVNIKIYHNNEKHFRLDSLAIMDHNNSEIPSNVQSVPSNVQSVPSNVQSVPSNVQSVPFNVQSVPSNVQSVPSNVQIHECVPNIRKQKDDLDIFMDKLIRESDQTGEKIKDISYDTHKKMEFESQRIRDVIDRLCDRVNDKWPNIGICYGCMEC